MVEGEDQRLWAETWLEITEEAMEGFEGQCNKLTPAMEVERDEERVQSVCGSSDSVSSSTVAMIQRVLSDPHSTVSS